MLCRWRNCLLALCCSIADDDGGRLEEGVTPVVAMIEGLGVKEVVASYIYLISD
jgi:hypothetical protein